MRDSERILEILDLVKEIWLQEPDVRFNQLIYNLQYSYSQQNDGLGQVKEVCDDGFIRTGFDLFNVEDSSFIAYLQTMVSKEEKK
jgi:uncharacterized protein YihD (DUF1040 family)